MINNSDGNIDSITSAKKVYEAHKTQENNNSKILNRSFMFEWTVGRILGKHYKLEGEKLLELGKSGFYDFKSANDVYFEVKYVRNGGIFDFARSVRNFFAHYAHVSLDKIIVVSNITVDEDIPNLIEINKHKIKLITLENLLFLCKDDDALRSELLLCLNTSTENVVPRPLDKEIEDLLFPDRKEIQVEKQDKSFYEKLNLIKPGKVNSVDFENFCADFIKVVFQDNIEQPETQRKNNHGLYRFDIVAPIKIDLKSRFGRLIYDKYNSCFLIFECKNYREPITQDEIYSTERYLYDNALRNVAIIFSRYGADKNAGIAIQGVLKEHGKLILVLDDEDISALEQCYYKNKEDKTLPSPFDYLYDKTIKFLLELDK